MEGQVCAAAPACFATDFHPAEEFGLSTNKEPCGVTCFHGLCKAGFRASPSLICRAVLWLYSIALLPCSAFFALVCHQLKRYLPRCCWHRCYQPIGSFSFCIRTRYTTWDIPVSTFFFFFLSCVNISMPSSSWESWWLSKQQNKHVALLVSDSTCMLFSANMQDGLLHVLHNYYGASSPLSCPLLCGKQATLSGETWVT